VVPVNRGEVVKAIADAKQMPATLVDEVLSSFFDQVAVTLAAGDDVTIRRFGKFEPRQRRAVTRLNPKTKIPIDVPAKTSVGFVPSSNLKHRLNETHDRGRKK
jgi:nucleoid DNA-binding protein